MLLAEVQGEQKSTLVFVLDGWVQRDFFFQGRSPYPRDVAGIAACAEACHEEDQSHDINQTDSVVVDEVKVRNPSCCMVSQQCERQSLVQVKALQTGSAQLRKTDEKPSCHIYGYTFFSSCGASGGHVERNQEAPPPVATSSRTSLLKARVHDLCSGLFRQRRV